MGSMSLQGSGTGTVVDDMLEQFQGFQADYVLGLVSEFWGYYMSDSI